MVTFILIGREIQCLPYAGFLVDISKVPYACDNVPYSLLSRKKRKTNPFGHSYFQSNV